MADADLRVDGFAHDNALLTLTAHAAKGAYLRTTTGSIPYLDYPLALTHSSVWKTNSRKLMEQTY